MINLKEYASKYVYEGILDDIDDQLEAGDAFMDNERAKKWSEKSRRTAKVKRQKAGYAMKGDFKIDDISQKELIKIIQKANNDKNIHGILVQMPLPKYLPITQHHLRHPRCGHYSLPYPQYPTIHCL
jgi:ClpP class serine protease